MSDRKDRKFWGRFAGIYDIFMKKEDKVYNEMYQLLRERLTSDMYVLELATGTGLIALAIADTVKRIEATDYSPQMIAEAKKKEAPNNVSFSVQNACELTYEEESFDAVIISNTLHIIPDPELALLNIRRVLKKDGVLIAPTFSHAANDNKGKLKAKLMGLVGFKAYHKWTAEGYCSFIEQNGFHVERKRILKASFPLTYVEARKA